MNYVVVKRVYEGGELRKYYLGYNDLFHHKKYFAVRFDDEIKALTASGTFGGEIEESNESIDLSLTEALALIAYRTIERGDRTPYGK
jgi:DNA-binding transcriptional regulator GbsR (MarR family)